MTEPILIIMDKESTAEYKNVILGKDGEMHKRMYEAGIVNKEGTVLKGYSGRRSTIAESIVYLIQ